MDKTEIKIQIDRILAERKISLSKFASEIGVEQASLWRFMNNKTGLSGNNLLKILQVLDNELGRNAAKSAD